MTDETAKRAELARLEAAFEERGGRGVDLAERIDRLRAELAWPGQVTVRFSEVHWIEVDVNGADLALANGGDVNIAGLAGALDEEDGITEAVNELLDLAVSEAGAMTVTVEVDGREIHFVRRSGETR